MNTNIEEAKRKKRNRLKHKHRKQFSGIGLFPDYDASIDFFNKIHNTDSIESSSDGDSSGEAAAESLQEAKRYVRRYYIRPQNIFCSNKAEILKALIELGNKNCSIYTLNNLGDEKDVTKLMNSDIIYYYDDGILYDKNHVKVMDYDLSIKNEENRKRFNTDVKNISDKEFKNNYEDRLTDVTELDETFYANHELDLDFDDINVYGENLTEAVSKHTCCICGEEFVGYGNNPEPYKKDGVCCDACNIKFVIPARLDSTLL